MPPLFYSMIHANDQGCDGTNSVLTGHGRWTQPLMKMAMLYRRGDFSLRHISVLSCLTGD